jgi:hypothetical protein
MKIFRYAVISVLLVCAVMWGTLAIYFSYLPDTIRYFGAVLFPLVSAGVLLFVRPKRKGIMIFAGVLLIVLFVWFSMVPSNDRNWQPDVADLPFANIEGDVITIHNIRNCDYRSETDYTVQYYDKTFDLNKLSSFDLFLSDWGLGIIVHTLVSFGFGDDDYLCISIETRKEKGEEYSSVKGFFRQYELIYVVGDERDLVRLRTNYRQGETVYLYRIQGESLEVIRKIFLDYLKYINRLKQIPEWYNALTGNCTTQIRGHTRPYAGKVWWDWRILANGYVDELAYELGVLDHSMSFQELKEQSIINSRAQAADRDPFFSKRIRKGLPGMNSPAKN